MSDQLFSFEGRFITLAQINMIKEQRSREDAAKTASENKDKNKKISDPIEKKGKRGKKVSSENKDKSENTEGKKSEDVNNLTAVPPVVDEEDKK